MSRSLEALFGTLVALVNELWRYRLAGKKQAARLKESAWLTGVLLVLTLSACTPTQTVGRAVPMPDVHVTAELSPGPPGENPTIVMVNPTTHSVYARCTVVIFGHHGKAIFRGTVPSGPEGLRSPPGRFVWGSGALADDKGHVFDFRGQRYRTLCNAFVWHGAPPV